MDKNGQKINKENIPSTFVSYFKEKVQHIVNESQIDPEVSNGKRKLTATSEHFMQTEHVIRAIAKDTIVSHKEHCLTALTFS